MKWIVLALLLGLAAAAAGWAAQPPTSDRCVLLWLKIETDATHEYLTPIYKCLKIEA
jgi:hypothetical protein